MGTEAIFRLAGLKYQDTIISANNSNDGKISAVVPEATCENAAPAMTKKNPA